MPTPLFPGISDEDILAALRASGANLAPPPDQLAAEVAAAPPPQPSPFFPASQVAEPPSASVPVEMPPVSVGAPDQAPMPQPMGVPPLPVRGPTDVLGAEADRAAQLQGSVAAHTRAIEGEAISQNNQLGRQGAVEDDFARRAQQVDLDFQAAREANHQAAAAETAQWLREMDNIANEEPNHQRFWQNQDRFGKGLWLLGMAFSSAGLIGTPYAGQRRNPVLEMLKEEIASDVQDQKESQARRAANAKTKGDLMLRGQEQRMADLRDDHSMAYQRLESLKRGAMLRAQQMSPDDIRARALLAGADYLGQEQLKIADANVKERYQAREGQANRNNQYAIANLHEIGETARATIAANERLSAARLAADSKGDFRQLPTVTGFTLRGGQPLTVPKDRYDSVEKLARQWTDQGAALQKLRAAFSDVSTFEKLMQNDAALVSAIEEAAGPIAMVLNGGGRLTDTDVARGYGALLGYNPKGFVSMIKGGNREEVLKLLDQRIASLPDRAANDVAISSGVQLKPGDLTFVPREDLVRTGSEAGPSRQSDLAKGGLTEPRPHPTTPDEYRKAVDLKAQTGNDTLPALPAGLDAEVTSFRTRAGQSPDVTVMRLQQASLKAIDDWKSAQLRTGADPKLTAEAAADARTRVTAIAGDEIAAGSKRMEAATDKAIDVVLRHGGIVPLTKADLVNVAHRAGLGTPTPDELEALTRAVRARIEASPSMRPIADTLMDKLEH